MSDVFTIIVLTYNNQQYLKDCIYSIIKQDYPYMEIIISDDCSDKFDKNNIENYINDNKKDNIVNFIINQNETNLGAVKNLNKAIQLGTGNYFMNLDGDDMLYDETIVSSMVKYFNETKYLAVTTFIEFNDANMENPYYVYPNRGILNYLLNSPAIEIYMRLCKGDCLAGPGFSYRRELIDQYGLYDEEYKLIADYPRYLYLTRNGCSIGMLDKIAVKYRNGVGIWTSKKTTENEHIKNMVNNDMLLIKKKEIEINKEN